MKSTKPPRIIFRSEGPSETGYSVYLGDDRIGWVMKHGTHWIATDTAMRDAGREHRTRGIAAKKLQRLFDAAVARGDL